MALVKLFVATLAERYAIVRIKTKLYIVREGDDMVRMKLQAMLAAGLTCEIIALKDFPPPCRKLLLP